MSRRTLRAALAIAAAVGAATVVACENSTSGADHVAPALDADGGSVDAGTAEAAPGPRGGGDGAAPVPECSACAATSCTKQLAACGDACATAIDCIQSCLTPSCEEECFQKVESAEGVAFKACMVGACSGHCKVFNLMVLGVESYAAASCARDQACDPASFLFRYRDLAECQEREAEVFTWEYLLPGGGTTGRQLDDCATAMSGLSCEDVLTVRAQYACMTRGRRAIDAPCEDGSQCETGFCSNPTIYTCGTCASPPQAGEPCAPGGCGWGLTCNAANTCVTTARIGDPCSDNAPCAGDSFCTTGGVCAALPATVGAPCGSATAAPQCNFDKGFVCNSATSGTCIAYTTADVGAACGLIGSTYTFCLEAATCTAGKCTARALPGDACDDTSGPYCTFPDGCVDGKCVALLAPAACQ